MWRITKGGSGGRRLAIPRTVTRTVPQAIPLVATLIAAIGILSVGSGCGAEPRDPAASEGADTVQVVASFYPLAEFTRAVAGDPGSNNDLKGRMTDTGVVVSSVTPAGVEPHDFEPSPRQLGEIERAELFIYNGGGLDPWAERFADSLTGTQTKTLDLNEVIGKDDPHFWLDPRHARTITGAISDRLSKINPELAQSFQSNRGVYERELGKLDMEFASGLSKCSSRTIVTTHNAFGYLAERYDFDIISIAGLSPEDDPSPRRMAEIARTLKQEEIGTIFFETLTSPKFAKTLASETGAKVAVLDPIEGVSDKDRAAGKDYLSIMRDNLAALRLAMGCG